MSANLSKRGFTLIELLIVVLIIAILAAIAVPNFLEFQVRAKVARARADMRTVATGLEAYAVDNDDYPPNDGYYNVLPVEITTPVAYLTSSLLADPFSDKEIDPIYGELARFYTYNRVVGWEEGLTLMAQGRPVALESLDAPGFNEGAFERYGHWRLVCNGPDRQYSFFGLSNPQGPYNPVPLVLYGADIPYDPTNGTVSMGNIHRTQKLADGVVPAW